MDMPVTNQDVLTFKQGLAGRLRLNRPRALHSLNRQMVRDMYAPLGLLVTKCSIRLRQMNGPTEGSLKMLSSAAFRSCADV